VCVGTWLIHIWNMSRHELIMDGNKWIYHRWAHYRVVCCDMTYSYVRHDVFTCETWLIHLWDVTRHVFMTRYAFMIDEHITHSIVCHVMWHDSFTYETWLIHLWDMTQHVFIIRYAFIIDEHIEHSIVSCVVTWLIHMWDMTRQAFIIRHAFIVDEHIVLSSTWHGVANVSRIDTIIGLFCRILSLL